MQDILGTEQGLPSKNEECHKLRDCNERFKVETYDWLNKSNKKVLFDSGLTRLEILCSVIDLLKQLHQKM